MKSKLLISLIIICILFSTACVSAADNHNETVLETADYHSFAELNQTISKSGPELNLEHDYKYEGGEVNITINRADKFTLNGNGHVLEGIADYNAVSFRSADVVTIKNLTFRNCRNSTISIESQVIFDNVKFINCSGPNIDSFITANNKTQFNNCIFENNSALYRFIESTGYDCTFRNTSFYGGNYDFSVIYVNRGGLAVEGCTFKNISARFAPAILYKGANFTVKRSKFTDLRSRLSGGAIIGKFFSNMEKEISPFLIEDCEFTNLTSTGDGGAIFFDMDSGSDYVLQRLNVINSNFTACKSKYGGAICNLGGILNVSGSKFSNVSAGFEGGAIYTSWCSLNIINSTISDATAEKNAGAIYFDKGRLTIVDSSITGSGVVREGKSTGRAIYAYDANLDFSASNFGNGGLSVYAVFSKVSRMDIEKNNDTFSLDNEDYLLSVESRGMHIDFANNTLIVDKLPSRFNATDWGWTTPNHFQGDNDDCWAFATVASLETALLKSTGVAYNLSQNYVQKLQLKYAVNGDLRISLTGFTYSGLGHALSWYGAILKDSEYDDRGIAADTDFNESRINLQDAVMISTKNSNISDLIKWAILKYGAVSVHKILLNITTPLNTTGENISVMDHGIHFVSLIGWNDGYNEELNATGYWIAKDSAAGAFDKIAYNDSYFLAHDRFTIVPQDVVITYIFENNIDYHMNYQTDLTALTGFDGNYTVYSNEFTSKYSELIGAVGTYFNDSGIEYSFDVYVNGAKVHTQNGVSEFAGFRTIVLSKYIPVKAGDKFKVVFKSNSVPYQAYSRQHYLAGMTFVSSDGKTFEDITLKNKTVCLKVYTVADDTKIINNADISVDYAGGKYFSVNVVTADGHAVGAGIAVKFNINGRTSTIKTDSNGVAKIRITDVPKKYTITTTYNGKSVKNTVTVKQVLKASKVTVKKTAKKFTLKATLKINGKLQKAKLITFKFAGKTYKVNTNSKGVAQKTLNKKVIQKLKKGKTYTVKVTYLKDTIKTTVKVR